MRGGAVQGSPEKVAVLGAPAKAFLIVGRGVAARARALTTVLTFLSICHTRAFKGRLAAAEDVDEDKERHGADWQGIKQPYQRN